MNNSGLTILQVSESGNGMRVDVYIPEYIKDLTRSRVQKLLKDGSVLINSEVCKKANRILKCGETIELYIPEPQKLQVEAENIQLQIVYQDESLAVINKPQGMVVHPAVGNYTGTLVNALLYNLDGLSGINGIIRPGIVHRLDKDTSGLLVVAKNDFAHHHLAAQIKDRTAGRHYMALVCGDLTKDGTIDAPLGRDPHDRKKMAVTDKNSRRAVTHFFVKERFGKYTLIEVKLETGRTHQIRVHMKYIGHPVAADAVYCSKKQEDVFSKLPGQFLHAYKLTITHPVTGEIMDFTAPLPAVMEDVLSVLRKRYPDYQPREEQQR